MCYTINITYINCNYVVCVYTAPYEYIIICVVHITQGSPSPRPRLEYAVALMIISREVLCLIRIMRAHRRKCLANLPVL